MESFKIFKDNYTGKNL